MGSTVALVDQNGNLTNTYTYDPAGAVTKTGTVSFPYQYAGAEFDTQTGLYHVGSYYDPVLERLVSGATPTGAAGPSLAGGSGPVSAGSGGAGPVGASGGPGLTLSQAGINAGIGAGAGAASVGALLLAAGASSEAPPVAIALYIGAGVDALIQGLLDLFGGGGSPDVRPKLTVPIHTIQEGVIGSRDPLLWSQAPAPGVLQKTVRAPFFDENPYEPSSDSLQKAVDASRVHSYVGPRSPQSNLPDQGSPGPMPSIPPAPLGPDPRHRFVPLPPYFPNPSDQWDRPYQIPLWRLPKPDKLVPRRWKIDS